MRLTRRVSVLKQCVRLYMSANANILKLQQRGLLQNVFPPDRSADIEKLLISSPQTIYCGFDPTADSLHVGNLLALVTLLHCQRAGHRPIVVLGGATARIGDPSGHSSDRKQLKLETIERNLIGIQENIERISAHHQKYFTDGQKSRVSPITIIDNRDWYQDCNVMDFLCDVGRHFRLRMMLSRHSVESRLSSGEGICLTEFMYQVFQAYDWLHLRRNYGCMLQIGGNDQHGNIVSGYELVTRLTNKPVYGVTLPLITSTTGDKLGKSAGNAVWLSPNKTSTFDFYQYFMRLPDSAVQQYLELFTFLPDNEIEHLMTRHKANPERRRAQQKLAEELTLLVHGEEGLTSAIRCTDALYGGTAEELGLLSESEVNSLFSNASSCQMFLDRDTTLFDVVMKAKCFRDERDAVRIISAGGVYLNGSRVSDTDLLIIPDLHILPNNLTLLRVGKKNYYIIRWLGMKQSQRE